MLSEAVDEDEVIVDDELMGDEEGEALALIVEDSPGYDIGGIWVEIVELGGTELSVKKNGREELELTELDESSDEVNAGSDS